MATYTNIDDLRAEIFRVTDEEMGDTILQRAAIISYNWINAALNGFYSVPFSSIPPLILDISDMMTKGLAILLDTRRGNPFTEEDLKTGEIGLAKSMLDDIRLGKMDIPGYTRLADRGAWASRTDYAPVFDVDSSLNHQPDTDLLEDIAEDRE